MAAEQVGSTPLSRGWWIAGLGAIGASTALLLWLLHLSTYDTHQQLLLVKSIVSGDLVHAFDGVIPPQTSGPGFGLFAVPVFVPARLVVDDQTAYLIAGLACLIPLAWSVVAASRATGVAARSGHELANVAVVVMGTPILASYIEAVHPADVLATAACLGAFAALAKRRVPHAFVLLGFALATRQWAIIALAVLAVLERGDARRHLVIGSLGVATVLILPFFAANAGMTILTLQAEVTSRGSLAAMAMFDLPQPVLHALSRYVPLIGTAVLCAWLARRRVTWSPDVAVAALAVALLIRPPVDPAASLYYAGPGYAFFVLLGPRTWRWLAAGVAGSVALLVRFSMRHRFPFARVVSVHLIEGPFLAPGVALSVATTLVLVAALGAATLHLVGLVRSRQGAQRPAPVEVGGP